jgi:hypothetical protein
MGNRAAEDLMGNRCFGDISACSGEILPDLSRKIYSVCYHPVFYIINN